MSNPTEQAIEHLQNIDENRRHLDGVSTERKEKTKQLLESVCEDFFDSENTTLRGFLEPLDLHFDPEEFIEQEPPIELTPEVIAASVYIDRVPETLGRYAMDEIRQKYIHPYTEMSDDELFMVTEYVSRYY